MKVNTERKDKWTQRIERGGNKEKGRAKERKEMNAMEINKGGWKGMKPTTVAARSEAWTDFARSNAGIMGSNPTWGIDVCVRLFCVCAVLCVGSGRATGSSPVQGILPNVYGIKKLRKRWSNKGL
jgi:hypothetical protein